jgi:xanthine dehydrogenase large subunit
LNGKPKPSWRAVKHGLRQGSHPYESAHLHVAGGATYVDDIPETSGTVHVALGLSRRRTRGSVRSTSPPSGQPGVVAVLTAEDIPGPNDCGPIVHDDPILAEASFSTWDS